MTLPTNTEIESLIGKLASDIADGKVKEPSDLTVNLNKQELRNLLNYITQPYNFLKHADRDTLATLDDSDFDPKGAIGHALTAFTMVCPDKPWPDEIKPYLEKNDLV